MPAGSDAGLMTHPTTEVLSLTDRVACLHAMSCVAWADGRLHADEVTVARTAAEVLGFDDATRATRLFRRQRLRRLPVHALSYEGRLAVYASAVWMALADGVLDRRERELLHVLHRMLGLAEEDGVRVEDNVYALGVRLCGWWPERYAQIIEHIVAEAGAPFAIQAGEPS